MTMVKYTPLLVSIALCLLFPVQAVAAAAVQDADSIAASSSSEKEGGGLNEDSVSTHKPRDTSVVHPSVGERANFADEKYIRLVCKIHNYLGGPSDHHDADISSPKSVNIHPSGGKFYVNSLEGAKTVVYSLPGLEKLAVIRHRFDGSQAHLWAPPSGLFKFRHYSKDLNTFAGKPVESEFSHDGRYLWVPYYRRSFDLNAQDPSALAIIDTSADSIVRVMEAGVLPKMIAMSPDGKAMAVAHWGDNTVGIIDISSANPSDWKYRANVAVGRQLFHDFSLTESVNRDANTGEALRGTVFTPDSRYILVGCMSGGGIAVIDAKEQRYLGKITGVMPNVRHLAVNGGWLYASINAAGYVQRIKLDKILEAIEQWGDSQLKYVSGWQSVKVAPGARTITLSPRGDYIFAACNFGSKICIVDSAMNMVGVIQADSYPVGLDISPDGKWLISTSQGRNSHGGNCVDIFELEGIDAAETLNPATDIPDLRDQVHDCDPHEALMDPPADKSKSAGFIAMLAAVAALLIFALALVWRKLFKRRNRK